MLVHKQKWTGVALALLVALLAAAAAPSADAAEPVTYQGWQYPSASRATADKPQSKVWFAAGSWWSLLVPPSGTAVQIHQLDRAAHTWRDTGVVIDDRPSSTGDALWRGGKLYVASRTASGPIRLVRASLTPGGSWSVDSGFPVTVADEGSESVTVDQDTTGTLWTTWTRGSRVWIAWSTDGGSTFSPPTTLPAGDVAIDSDDISAVVAYHGQVGVMWSDQQSGALRFAFRSDGDPPDTWSEQTVLQGTGQADDHINLKSFVADPEGRLFAVVKTSLGARTGGGDQPLIVVLSRDAAGRWSSAVAGTVADRHTRPQLVIDAAAKTLYVLMTAPVGGGVVYVKRSSLHTLSFEPGLGEPFMSWPGVALDDVSVSKDPVDSTTGLVALASDIADRRYYHAELDLHAASGPPSPGPAPDTTPPTAPTDLRAAADGTAVRLTWTASRDDTQVVGYQVHRDGVPLASVTGTSFTDADAPAGDRRYTVLATDGAGNVSEPSTDIVVTLGTAQPPARFSDVPEGHNFHREISWLAQQEITIGIGDGSAFGPRLDVARQEMAAFLYRLAGRPVYEPPPSPRFRDVPASHPFYTEVSWLADQRVTRGAGDGSVFAPRSPVSRGEMAAFLYRFAGQPAYEPPQTPRFTDVPLEHGFYREISWLAEQDVTTGTGDGSAFGSLLPVTRQEMAAFLYRFAHR